MVSIRNIIWRMTATMAAAKHLALMLLMGLMNIPGGGRISSGNCRTSSSSSSSRRRRRRRRSNSSSSRSSSSNSSSISISSSSSGSSSNNHRLHPLYCGGLRLKQPSL